MQQLSTVGKSFKSNADAKSHQIHQRDKSYDPYENERSGSVNTSNRKRKQGSDRSRKAEETDRASTLHAQQSRYPRKREWTRVSRITVEALLKENFGRDERDHRDRHERSRTAEEAKASRHFR